MIRISFNYSHHPYRLLKVYDIKKRRTYNSAQALKSVSSVIPSRPRLHRISFIPHLTGGGKPRRFAAVDLVGGYGREASVALVDCDRDVPAIHVHVMLWGIRKRSPYGESASVGAALARARGG